MLFATHQFNAVFPGKSREFVILEDLYWESRKVATLAQILAQYDKSRSLPANGNSNDADEISNVLQVGVSHVANSTNPNLFRKFICGLRRAFRHLAVWQSPWALFLER
jgi:hypothetical protein